MVTIKLTFTAGDAAIVWRPIDVGPPRSGEYSIESNDNDLAELVNLEIRDGGTIYLGDGNVRRATNRIDWLIALVDRWQRLGTMGLKSYEIQGEVPDLEYPETQPGAVY